MDRVGERWNGKRHAAFVLVQDIPFALLRAPVGCCISGRMFIHWMPGSDGGNLRAPSARNVLNSQSSAIALSVPSLPTVCQGTKKGTGEIRFLFSWERGERPLSPFQLLWLPSKAVFRAQMAHFSFFGCMVPQTGHFTRFSSASAAKSFTSLHCGQQ